MSQFINDKDKIVTQAIDGLLQTTGHQQARLDGYPHIKVVLRADWKKSHVALVSGGGSGHEPSHAGFVGQGLLTAAVCGEVFASPSTDAVLAAILSVTSSSKGCLLIVKNYTGDRLNFGLAAERARALGLPVRMVVVGDDVALPELPQPRGVAGTLFVHKIAGALAASGSSLDDVASLAERIARGTVSIGMSLDTCTVPGSPKERRIGEGMAELGLGIHGEPGVQQVSYSDAQTAMDKVVETLSPHAPSGELVGLLNNLGGCTPLEMGILADALLRSKLGHRIKWMIGPAPLMTSLDMRGFSVSLYAPSADELTALQEPVECHAWPGFIATSPPKIIDLPKDGLRPVALPPSSDRQTRQWIEDSCRILMEAEAKLNDLDAKSGDGDTGSTLAKACHALNDNLESLPLAKRGDLFQAISQELGQSMGGSSGVLLAIFFAAAGDAVTTDSSIGQELLAGLERIKQVGGATLGDRTMIDALEPALRALDTSFSNAAIKGREGANATAAMTKARAGRASYVSEDNLVGHNDPGAEAVAILFEELAAKNQQ